MPGVQHSTSLPDLSIGPLDDVSARTPLQRSTSSSQISHTTDVERLTDELAACASPGAHRISGREAAELLGGAARALDAHCAMEMAALPPDAQRMVETIEDMVHHDPGEVLARTQRGTPAHALAEVAAAHLAELQRAQGGEPLTPRERGVAMLDFLGAQLRSVARNEFQSPFGRWAANVANVGVRTGLIVGLATTMRQLIGFGIEKAEQLHDLPISSRTALGAAAMLVGPGLNIAGFIRDEVNHTATAKSRTARLAMGALSLGTLVFASQCGEPSALGSLMSSFGPQMLSYCLARDVAQVFFPLNDNAPINAAGTAAQSVLYGGVQVGVSEAFDALAPHSGAGLVMGAAAAARQPPAPSTSTAQAMTAWFTKQLGSSATSATPSSTPSVADRVHDAVRALQPTLADDVKRGLLNTSAELFDDLVRPAISRAIQVSQTRRSVRNEALAEGHDPHAALAALPRDATEGLRVSTTARIPSRTQVANQFLTTNAMRSSFFESILGASLGAAVLLGKTSLSPENQGHLINAIVGGTVMVGYPAFLYAHAQRTPPANAAAPPLRNGVGPEEAGEHEMIPLMDAAQRRA